MAGIKPTRATRWPNAAGGDEPRIPRNFLRSKRRSPGRASVGRVLVPLRLLIHRGVCWGAQTGRIKSALALQDRTDGVVVIRPRAPGDAAILIAGRDDEWRRWLGPGRDDPAPAACIVVAAEVVGWIDYDGDLAWLQTGEVNIGYNVFGPHRCNGYASRALELLIRYLDECTAVHTATLLIDPRNAPSLAVARRTGFVATGAVGGARYFKRAVRRC